MCPHNEIMSTHHIFAHIFLHCQKKLSAETKMFVVHKSFTLQQVRGFPIHKSIGVGWKYVKNDFSNAQSNVKKSVKRMHQKNHSQRATSMMSEVNVS